MCGIAGSIGSDVIDSARIDATLSRMRNRGPNANGTLCEKLGSEVVTLLHSRLAIIDVNEESNQPMHRDGCTLIFNGEIYNYIEVREKLEGIGYKFLTGSDSEVLIVAYQVWGTKCLDVLEGMWAFAILDRVRNHLFISRDRFGEKPLLYTEHNGTLYFASEAKALRSLTGIPLKPNLARVRRYLVNGFRSLYKSDDTFFDDVYEFPAACYALITCSNDMEPITYWHPELRPEPMTMEDAIEGTKQRLQHALEIRLRSDVPIAFCLSGGVDSTTLAGMAAKYFGQDLHAFSVIDSDERYNESDNINKMVEFLGCEHFVTHVNPDGFVERVRGLISDHDAPVPTISYYVHSFLSEQIKSRGFSVVMSGTGADELFTGYYDHYSYWLAQLAKSRDIESLVSDWQGSYGSWVNNPLLQDPLAFKKEPGKRDHLFQNQDFFNSLMIDPIDEGFSEKFYTDDLVRNRMLNELTAEVVPVILRADDSNSMRWSVENRSPYLDRDLAEFLLTVPTELLIHNGTPKWLLRSAAKGYVPDSVRLDTRKRGFNASIESLLDRNDPKVWDWLMESSPIFDVVRRDAIEELLSRDLSDNSFSKFAFSFISAKIFLESDLALGREYQVAV
jgi:asparagine synthase (glutamine-hydrolysing)